MIALCHPDDAKLASRFYIQNERLIITERCPRQAVVFLGDRLALQAESGGWFDTALEAAPLRVMSERQRQFDDLLDSGWRCKATTKTLTQCRNPVHKTLGYCKKHDRERDVTLFRIGEGLDQTSANPLSSKDLEEIGHVAHNLLFAIHDIEAYLKTVEPQPAYLVRTLERLETDREILLNIVDVDKREDQRQRKGLRVRIQRMVERIEAKWSTYRVDGKAIHSRWMEEGGPSQTDSTVEELKAKVDWLYLTYEEAFESDTREWLPPGLSGNEPGLVKKVNTR